MLEILWDSGLYAAWFFTLSAILMACERLFPWRPRRMSRRDFLENLFWMVFNGYWVGFFTAFVVGKLIIPVDAVFPWLGLPHPSTLRWMESGPWLLRLAVILLVKDFCQWVIHWLMHRWNWLWEFHKLHHSSEELDWMGSYRFHWMEHVIFQFGSYLPLVMLEMDDSLIVACAMFELTVTMFAHANVVWDWGPLRYVVTSPRFHVWHHDEENRYPYGQNFGVVLSGWDWLFGTAYFPAGTAPPERLGFRGMEKFPKGIPARMTYPLVRWFRGKDPEGNPIQSPPKNN